MNPLKMPDTATRRAAPNVTVRQLRAFVTVAQLGSFVDASRALHVTSSALSIVIAELEGALGFRVLDRTTRRVRVSGPGEQYLPYAQRILFDFESAQRCAVDLRNQKTGVVRVAASQVIAWTLLPPVFAAFRRLRPDVRIDPMDLGVDEILPALEEGRADIGVTLKMPSDTLEAVTAFESRVYVACRADRWAGRKRVRWDELSGEPLIFTGTDTPARINAALPDGPVLEAAWQVAHTGTALALVASGFGSAICAGYVRPMTAIHKLRMIPLVEPTVLRSFSIYASRARSMGPAVDAFRAFLASHFAAAPGGLVEELQTRL
ncbi:MAG TPA: LysR substrate-binding domain-containing protein [Ramlibacter sp.]|nr:LysR substrate-binding domain-containing protein [Ramlibacter sp.]